MSKADTLLKRATFFERLALYGDRKSYLQALAQDVLTWDPHAQKFTDSQIKATLSNVATALSQWAQQHGKRVADASGSPRVFPDSISQSASVVMDAARQSNFDNALLQRVDGALRQLLAARLPDADGDARSAYNSTVFNTMSDAQTKVSKTLQAGGAAPDSAPEDQGPSTPGMGLVQMEGHAVPEKEAPKPKPASPTPINRTDQQALANFVNQLVQSGDAPPTVDPSKLNDGILGLETRKALEIVKDYYGKTYPTYDPKKGGKRMTDQQAIQAAKYNTK